MAYNQPHPGQPFPQANPSAGNPYDRQEDLRSSGYGNTSAEEANYYNRRSQHLDVYNDPYLDPSDHSHERNGPTAAPSSVSIGPWDSASQRSLSTSSRHPLPTSHATPLSDGQDGSSNPARHLRNKPSNMTAGGLSYIDEEGDYYRSPHPRPASASRKREDELEMHGLVSGAARMGGRDGDLEHAVLNGTYGESKYGQYEDGPYAWPPLDNVNTGVRSESKLMALLLFPTGLDRVLGTFGWDKARIPVDQAIERKKRGVPGQRFPVMTWVLTAIMVGVMIYEIIQNNALTGNPISTRPTFNYMIGPSPSVLINIGARFPPCMKLVPDIPPPFNFACLDDLNDPPTSTCNLAQICGHGLTTTDIPNQTWRFFVPIFLHVGIVHLILNMVAQMTVGALVEREMGSIPYLIVYFAGGVYGFLLGGNFSRVGIPSAGASGALFAVNACVLVDLLMHWKYEERPKLKAFFLALEFVVGIAVGYIPNAVDGLAHLGGFAMGLLLGSVLYPSISETRTHRFVLWGVRAFAVALAAMAFVLTTRNFYTTDPNAACKWCKYLSCIPVAANNYCSGTGITQSTVQSTRRMLEL